MRASRLINNPPYWLSPGFASISIVGMSLVCFLLIPEQSFAHQFFQPKARSQSVLVIYCALGLIFLLGAALGQSGGSKSESSTGEIFGYEHPLRALGTVAFWATLLGYCVYFGTSNISPQKLMAALGGAAGANYALRDSFEKTPGVTSMMNLAGWWILYVAYKIFVIRRPINRVEWVGSAIVVGLTILRGFAVNERRVIFELFIPAAVACAFLKTDWTPKLRSMINWAPIAGPAVLVAVFLSTEYFRSWVNFYSGKGAGYFGWAVTRLLGYYATALNNGVTIQGDGLRTWGTMTFSGIFKLPLMAEVFGLDAIRAKSVLDYKMALARLTNPELNNPGGLIVPLIDFGWPLGAAIVLIFGVASGVFFRRACERKLFAVLTYTVFYFSFLEMTRVWFITGPIALVNLLYLCVFFAVYRLVVVPRRQVVVLGREDGM